MSRRDANHPEAIGASASRRSHQRFMDDTKVVGGMHQVPPLATAIIDYAMIQTDGSLAEKSKAPSITAAVLLRRLATL